MQERHGENRNGQAGELFAEDADALSAPQPQESRGCGEPTRLSSWTHLGMPLGKVNRKRDSRLCLYAMGSWEDADEAEQARRARALASPLRMRILRLCLHDARTNKELADELGVNPGTLLHHIRTLVDTGFLAAGEPRRGSRGAREVPYLATRRSWNSGGDDISPHAHRDLPAGNPGPARRQPAHGSSWTQAQRDESRRIARTFPGPVRGVQGPRSGCRRRADLAVLRRASGNAARRTGHPGLSGAIRR